MKDSSWESSHSWYDQIVGEKGHYYHQKVIFPAVLRILQLKAGDVLLDLGCGQGAFAQHLPKGVSYTGIDLSRSLIKKGRERAQKESTFVVGDITQPLSLQLNLVSHITAILSLQNVQDPQGVFQNAFRFLKPKGKFLLLLNHPCFRIPRQSSWGLDVTKKLQYRRIDRYMTPLTIPIHTHPSKCKGKDGRAMTYSFHFPLSAYVQGLSRAGFMTETMEEWVSDKKSYGTRGKIENFSRLEFPLFLMILASRA